MMIIDDLHRKCVIFQLATFNNQMASSNGTPSPVDFSTPKTTNRQRFIVVDWDHPNFKIHDVQLHPLPSGYIKIAIENGHRNSGFSHEKLPLSIAMLNYQRVS